MRVREDNIYLIGFMGAGKSTIGELLAATLQRPFADTDFLIEERCDKSITRIFEDEGEAFFRKREREILAEVAKLSGQVVSLGGGGVIDERNRRAIEKSGVSVYLQWPFQVLSARIRVDISRPLVANLNTESALKKLYEERQPYYAKADYIIKCDEFDTPQHIVSEIVKKLEGEL